ncbi:NAD(P)-binding protein [Streptomyces olivaceus]|uniref:NAD(P)-binding protein n=1 Tax=Streptomyces olivaceus TaxID=47716 RepID=UPI003B987362
MAGGVRAGLAAGCHLRRQGIDFTVLEAGPGPGGAWRHMGDSLHLFSPADHSSRLTADPARAAISRAGRAWPPWPPPRTGRPGSRPRCHAARTSAGRPRAAS